MIMRSSPDFSIITPSYDMLSYLRRCCASVADQEDVALEHIVVDGGSTDGTVDWLRLNPQLRSISEKDNGMYDAINKGLLTSQGHIVAYLNCDEQYLPSSLKAVKECFDQHPNADVIFGDTLVVDPCGNLIAYRKSHRLRRSYVQSSYLYTLSCSLFFRRRVIQDGFLFDTNLKAVADTELVVRLLRRQYRFVHLKRYLSVFTVTGHNKIKAPASVAEYAKFRTSFPIWVRALEVPLNLARIAEKTLSGAYFQQLPFSYEIYTDDACQRQRFTVHKATFRLQW